MGSLSSSNPYVYDTTIALQSDGPANATVSILAKAERDLTVAPYDTSVTYFPIDNDSSTTAQIGVIQKNILGSIKFNLIQ